MIVLTNGEPITRDLSTVTLVAAEVAKAGGGGGALQVMGSSVAALLPFAIPGIPLFGFFCKAVSGVCLAIRVVKAAKNFAHGSCGGRENE